MKYIQITGITVLILFLVACGQKKLEAFKVECNSECFSPVTGVDSTKAKELIVQWLKENGVKGKIEEAIIIEEITKEEIWDNINTQLFTIEVDYAWIYGIALIKDGDVLTCMSGMPTKGIYAADLDGDGHYEIYSNIAMGSGMISYEVLGYNVKSIEEYHLQMRGKKDYGLFVEEGKLKAIVSKYPSIHDVERTGVLQVKASKEYDKKDLVVK